MNLTSRGERGSATPLGLLLMALIALLAWLGLILLGHWAAGQRAGQVADLAALAAARENVSGGPACERAGSVAARNGAELTGCRCHGETMEVAVVVGVRPRLPGLPDRVAATAQAAPVR